MARAASPSPTRAALRLGRRGEAASKSAERGSACACSRASSAAGESPGGKLRHVQARDTRTIARRGSPHAPPYSSDSRACRSPASAGFPAYSSAKTRNKSVKLATSHWPELAQPAHRGFEVRDAERQPPHLDLRPATPRARPDLRGEAHPLQTEVRIVTADLERLVEHAQRVVEAARGDVDVSEIGANECAELDDPPPRRRVVRPPSPISAASASWPVSQYAGIKADSMSNRLRASPWRAAICRASTARGSSSSRERPTRHEACSSMIRARSPCSRPSASSRSAAVSVRTRRQVLERPRDVARPQPLGGAPMPARRRERLAGLLPVMREQRGLLVELARRAPPRSPRATAACTRAPALAQLRAERHLLRQRVLEGVLGHRVERLLVDELARLAAPPAPRAARRPAARRRGEQDRLARTPCRSPPPSAAPASRAPAGDRCAPRARACTVAGTVERVDRRDQPIARRACPARCPDSISDCTTSSVKNGLPPVRAWIASASPRDARVGAEQIARAARGSPPARAAPAASAGSTTSASSRRGTRGGS